MYDTNYNKERLTQEKFVWRILENMGVEAMVRLGKRLGAAEMFWDDAGTCARGTKGLELRDGTNMCQTMRLAKQAKVAGTFGNGGTL